MGNRRLAVVKSTGRRYLVAGVHGAEEGNPRVQLWGELVSFKGLATRHEAIFTLPLADVAMSSVELDQSLVRSLWFQGVAVLRERGVDVQVNQSRRGNLKAIVHREETKEEAELRMIFDEIRRVGL